MKFFEKLTSPKRREKNSLELHPSVSESDNSSKDIESQRRTILENLSSWERELTEAEFHIVENADQSTSAIMERYGLTPKKTDPSNVHIIPTEKWPGGGPFFARELNGMVIPESYTGEKFKLAVVHELFHLKGVNFLPTPLTEAIVERLTNEAINLDDPSLEGGRRLSGTYTYIDNMIAFDSLLEKIVKSTPSGITDLMHTYTFFAKAHLSGDITHLSFLDDIFGPGTLDSLNKLNDNFTLFEEFVNHLEAKKI